MESTEERPQQCHAKRPYDAKCLEIEMQKHARSCDILVTEVRCRWVRATAMITFFPSFWIDLLQVIFGDENLTLRTISLALLDAIGIDRWSVAPLNDIGNKQEHKYHQNNSHGIDDLPICEVALPISWPHRPSILTLQTRVFAIQCQLLAEWHNRTPARIGLCETSWNWF